MIIPRCHVTRVSELSPEESHAIHTLVDRMVDTLERLYPDEPAAIHVNHARHKSVPHLHYHVLPAKGSLREHFVAHEGVEHRVRASTEESTATAKLLRQTMEK